MECTKEQREMLYQRSGFPQELAEVSENLVQRILASEETRAFFTLCDDSMFQRGDPYLLMKNWAPEHGWALNELALGFMVLHAAHARETYRALGWPEDIYYASMRDIVIWAKDCQKATGAWGIRKQYRWIQNLMQGLCIRVGRLEFYPFNHYNRERFVCPVGVIEPDDMVAETHIPEDGPLLPELCLDAFKRLYQLLGKQGVMLFKCESWLLDPEMKKFMSPNSNIIKFQENFRILSFEPREDQGDLWRVFGHLDAYDVEKLPRETSLQRGYADYLAQGGKMGEGFGVFFFDGEKILK